MLRVPMSPSPPTNPPPPSLHIHPPPPPRTGFLGWISRPLGMVITMGLIGLLTLVAFVAFFVFYPRDYQLTESQKACLLTAETLVEHYDIEFTPEAGTWDARRYLDGAVEVDYIYDPPDHAVWINCSLSIQPSILEAKIIKESYWQGATLAYSGGDSIEEDNSVFRWGDSSRFAYLREAGQRYGTLFVTRKGTKVFFLHTGNWGIEDPDEIATLLTPFLERYEREVF